MRTSLALVAALCAFAAAAQPAGAAGADTKGWCNAVIRVNTKAGTMKNKRFVLPGQYPAGAWKKVIDWAVANRERYVSLAPAEIKTAVKHQVAWFAKVKANHYMFTASSLPMTIADVKKISNFEKTKCGIKFST
jgi:hypothetical protein